MKVFLLCFLFTWISFEVTSGHTGGLTAASGNEKRDINQMIDNWKLDFVTNLGRVKSGVVSHYGTRTRKTYRIDFEGMSHEDNRLARFRIQSGTLTYGSVMIAVDYNFGRQKIQQVMRDSVESTQIRRLYRP